MQNRRIHVMGASGAGVTTLGRALATALALPHHDTDDYFWQPTTPPYQTQRPAADRLRLMREIFVPRSGWVLSGSVSEWANEIIARFDLVVFVQTAHEVRLQRLRVREAIHFGKDAVAPGGWHHEDTESFIDWAAHYEDGDREGRTLAGHLAWLEKLSCTVVRVDGARPLGELVAEVCRTLDAGS